VAKPRLLLTIGSLLLAIPLAAQLKLPTYAIGVSVFGPSSCPSAPLFIGGVDPGSPAALAGIHPGDQLLAVDGQPIHHLADVHISSAQPGTVVLALRRHGANLTFTVPRVRSSAILAKENLRQLDDGTLGPIDDTDAQLRRQRLTQSDLERSMRAGDSMNVFPGHYPADLSLYYPGFELFTWNHGQNVIVGGIDDGPAKQKGVRWGDRILSVNGVDPRGKSLPELERLFSSPLPARMTLSIDRFGVQKQFTFQLARASDVLKASGWKMFEGEKVPLWIPAEYARCFK
jgi:C-terminal processing protease CtpA/Prc